MALRLNDYQCPQCDVKREALARENENVICERCHVVMKKLPAVFSINMGAAGAYGYYDDNLGQYISTNRQRREVMRQQGVTEKGGTPKMGDAWV